MAEIIPYLKCGGKAVEAMGFYQGVFGGEPDITLVKDSPIAGNMPPEMGGLVFHSELKTPSGVNLLASDIEDPNNPVVKGNSISMGLMCDSEEQLREWYGKLSSDGGKETWPAAEADWGAIYGECVDKYGIIWMLNFDKPDAA